MALHRAFEVVVTRASTSAEITALQELTADLFATVVDLTPHEVEHAIERALKRLTKVLDLDWCELIRFDDVEASEATEATIAWRPHNCPWSTPIIRRREVVAFSSADEIPDEVERNHLLGLGVRSGFVCPLVIRGDLAGAIWFVSRQDGYAWPAHVHSGLLLLTKVIAGALSHVHRDAAMVARGNGRRDHDSVMGGSFIAQSSAMRQVLHLAEQVAPTDSTVLLLGETGSGKELLAHYIHDHSARRQRAMVRVNCAAIPATLIESELFGREKGAFTGATTRQVGRFELADQSTIFLDEIGDLSHDVQVKLLRVLEERRYERLGNPTPLRVDTRVIAATHRNLEASISAGTFREDLFYRLNVFPIHVPPLRDRPEDVAPLVAMLAKRFSRESGLPVGSIPAEDITALQRYKWPGNIRELRNVVERAIITATGSTLRIPAPDAPVACAQTTTTLLADVERDHIQRVLESTAWRIRGQDGAAARLGLAPTTLEARMARLGLVRQPPTLE
jgi:formate hydrogenlyase transcriptional activator